MTTAQSTTFKEVFAHHRFDPYDINGSQINPHNNNSKSESSDYH